MCCTVVAELRRQATVERSAVADVISVDACLAASQTQTRTHHELNKEAAAAAAAAPGGTRRRVRRKRDSEVTRTLVDAAGDSTDSSEDVITAAAGITRPSRKLRRKKKTRTKKTKNSGAECPEQSTAPVEINDDGVKQIVDVGSSQNAAVTTFDRPTPNFVNVCIDSPEVDEVDRLSCEPDGSSSRPEPEMIDYSECSSSRADSRSPTQKASPLPPSTGTTTTSLYGQNSGFLSDVHGSLPLLPRALDDDRRLVAGGGRPSELGHRLPKSTSLQGYRHFLSVDDATTGRHGRHRRRLKTAGNYRGALADRHTLSRLDVEHINRSQIFQMISGDPAR